MKRVPRPARSGPGTRRRLGRGASGPAVPTRAASVLLATSLFTGLAALVACGDPPGSPCEITGSGFHARDACRHQCLSRWSITCPDGERITPGVCTGRFGCEPGGCPEGQLCYHDDDPFDDRSFCVPDDVCGPLDAGGARAWELERVAAQADVRAERTAREARRARWRAENPDAPKTASPAAPPQPPPAAADPQEPAPPTTGPGDAPPAAAKPEPTATTPPRLTCAPTTARAAVAIPTPDGEAPFDADDFVELRAGETFTRALPHGWQLALLPSDHGWSLRLFDRQTRAGRVDLSAVTPPYHGPANARDIEGWHFRNADDTGPNTGDVNAPQDLRLFVFSTGLIGTGGFRPPRPGATDASSPGAMSADTAEAEGRGWLRLLDHTLTPPDAGERAGLASMRFQACLTWPHPTPEQEADWTARREASQRAHDARDPTYSPEEREAIGRCGLDLTRHRLQADVLPRLLELDVDGDDALDALYPVRRVRDGARMLALCRAGTWLELIGPDHPLLADRDLADLVRALEAWRVVPPDHGPFGYVDEAPWPEAEGDVIVLERIEKGLGLLYWQAGALRARSLYRYVEP